MNFHVTATVAEQRLEPGDYIFKITDYDAEKVKFGKLFIKMETANGQKHSERFDFKIETSKNMLARLLNTALQLGHTGNITIDQDMVKASVGRFVKVTVKHNSYAAKGEDGEPLKDDNGQAIMKTAVNLSNYQQANEFEKEDLPF